MALEATVGPAAAVGVGCQMRMLYRLVSTPCVEADTLDEDSSLLCSPGCLVLHDSVPRLLLGLFDQADPNFIVPYCREGILASNLISKCRLRSRLAVWLRACTGRHHTPSYSSADTDFCCISPSTTKWRTFPLNFKVIPPNRTAKLQ